MELPRIPGRGATLDRAASIREVEGERGARARLVLVSRPQSR